MEKAGNTFAFVALEFIAKRETEGMGPAGVERARRLIEKDLASIGGLPIAELSATVLLAALRKREQREIVESAHRARGLTGQIFRYAIATGRGVGSRCGSDWGSGAPTGQALREHHSSGEDRELLRAIHSCQGSPVTVAALELAPMVFVRPGELRCAEWSEFDLDKAVWDIPAAKMKMKHPHLVPLDHSSNLEHGLVPAADRAVGRVGSADRSYQGRI